jgi:hypothetical protein
MSKFQVSEEFKLFQAQAATAFKEAGQAEHGVSMGTDLPVGTSGSAKITGATAGKTKPKVVAGQSQPGKPFIIMEFEFLTPESHVGRKSQRYFDLSHHEQYSSTQKLSDWWDWMVDAGCPQEVRTLGDPNGAFAWAAQAERTFNFIVESGYNGRKDVKSVPGAGALPTATSTQSLMNAIPPTPPTPTFIPPTHTPTLTPTTPPTTPVPDPTPTPAAASGHQPGTMVKCWGQDFIFVSYQEGGLCTLRSPATGQEMPNIQVSALA